MTMNSAVTPNVSDAIEDVALRLSHIQAVAITGSRNEDLDTPTRGTFSAIETMIEDVLVIVRGAVSGGSDR